MPLEFIFGCQDPVVDYAQERHTVKHNDMDLLIFSEGGVGGEEEEEHDDDEDEEEK